MAVIALDIGRKRVGVARSRSGRLVEPVGVWPRKSLLSLLPVLVETEKATVIVIGYCDLALRRRLTEATTASIVVVDETRTTAEAQQRTCAIDHADAAAAAIILERYLQDQHLQDQPA